MTPNIRGASAALFIFLSLVLSFEGVSSEPDARAILESVRKAYSSSPSIVCTFVQTYAPAGFAETAPETGRLVMQAPDRVRFDYDGPEKKVFTFDGKSARQLVEADKQMIVRTLAPEERARLPLVFFESPDALLARYTARVVITDTGLTEITLVPRSFADPKSITLLASPSGDVKRLVIVDAANNRTSFTFTQKMPGPKRPETDFALVPRPGTKILTE